MSIFFAARHLPQMFEHTKFLFFSSLTQVFLCLSLTAAAYCSLVPAIFWSAVYKVFSVTSGFVNEIKDD